MTFSGDLRGGINLSDVLQNIAANRLTGTLHVRWLRKERFIRFDSGLVTGFSLGKGKGLPFVDHLRDRGYVDEKDLDRLVKKASKSRKSHYRVVLDGGFFKDDDFLEILIELAQEQIYDVLLLRDAEYSFDEGAAPKNVFDGEQTRLGLKLEVGPLLMETARRADELERIRNVMASDQDLFVHLDGWEDLPLDDVAREVGELLNGATDVRTIIRQTCVAPFEVMKAVCDLVHQGGARPCTSDEIQKLASEALRNDEVEEALRLIEAALRIQHSNKDLRLQRAELLQRLGRGKDAASDYALLGHECGRVGEIADAIEYYDRAIELEPTDLPLHETRLELIRQSGDVRSYITRMLELADLELDMGLADRARALLAGIIGERRFMKNTQLIEKLAKIEAALGHWSESSQLYVRLADLTLRGDQKQGLDYLRKGLEQCPDDLSIAARVAEIETGRFNHRRKVQKRVGAVFALVAVATALVIAGVAEIRASHEVVKALDRSLGDLRDGEAIDALGDLEGVVGRYGWTITGRITPGLIERVVDLQLAAIVGLLAEARYDQADRLLEALIDELDRPRVFAKLPRARDPQSARAILRAFSRIDSPRSLPIVARLSLELDDEDCLGLCEEILETADDHRADGHESQWTSVYPYLEDAVLVPETREKAKRILTLLRGSRD